MKISKKISYSSLIAANIILGIGNICADGPTVTPSGYYTHPSGGKYACTGDSIELTASGWKKDPPGARCCKNGEDGTWDYQSSTYSWSGDASGSSSTASLNTSSEGAKSATCNATHSFKCSATGSSQDGPPESASLTEGISVHTNETHTAVPGMNGSTIDIDSKNLPETLWSTSFNANGTEKIERYLKGTISDISLSETFTKDGAEQNYTCGGGIPDVSRTTTFNGSVGLSYGPFSWEASVSYTETVTISKTAEDWKRWWWQWYIRKVSNGTGNFSGQEKYKYYEMVVNEFFYNWVFDRETSWTSVSETASIGGTSQIDFAYNDKFNKCCPLSQGGS